MAKTLKWITYAGSSKAARSQAKGYLNQHYKSKEISSLSVRSKRSNVPTYSQGKVKAYTIRAKINEK